MGPGSTDDLIRRRAGAAADLQFSLSCRDTTTKKMGDPPPHQPRPPVHNSEVYLLSTSTPFPPHPPPSPPSPITPAESDFCAPTLSLSPPSLSPLSDRLTLTSRLTTAIHVLTTEALALSALSTLYTTSPPARSAFHRAVSAITRHPPSPTSPGGKLIITGVGKSGHIARKLVATFNSLAIPSVFLHPTEALHGDLGQIHPSLDTLLLLTFSGRTPELLALLPHLPADLPLILLTSRTDCEIARLRGAKTTILLPAPIPESEEETFGVAAPTTSTAVALAVGDALAVVVAGEMHGAEGVKGVFGRNHPGGAIGAALRGEEGELRGVAVGWEGMEGVEEGATGGEVLMAAVRAGSGWVKVGGDGGVVSPRGVRRLGAGDLGRRVKEIGGLVVRREEWVSMAAGTTVREAAAWMGEEDGDVIVAVVDERGGCIGLVEVGRLLEEM